MKKLALVCSLMLVLIPSILAGCTSTVGTVPTNLRDFSFSDMWNKTVNATSVNEASARIAGFQLYIGHNSSLEFLYCSFWGCDTRGNCKLYSVDIDPTGRIRAHSDSTDLSGADQLTINPGVLFDELDKAGLARMFSANTTTNIVSQCEGGAVFYSNDFAKLSLLNECGELIPLKQIMFRSTTPWFTLSISTMTEMQVDTFRHTEEMWFLSQDLGKATDVEYSKANESSFGIYLVDTGELMLSQQDIKLYNASTNEIELNDEGLKRWSSFFPDIMSLDGKQFAVKIGGQEIFQGRFQSPAPFSDFYYPDENTISYTPGADTIPISFNCFDPRISNFFQQEGLLSPSFGIYLVDTREMVLSDEEIESYNASTHEIALNEAGIDKWNSYIPYDDSFNPPIPKLGGLYQRVFAIKVNGEEIYRGKFWSAASSQSYDGVVILDALFPLDNGHNTIRIDNGYPAPISSTDSMNDPRITDFFEQAGMLQ